MKKSRKPLTYCLLVIFFLSITIQPVSAKLEDVPSDHWAYQAVSSLVDRGYLSVYEDGTFQGTESVDRYTLAVTLARILDEIEAGRVTGSMDDAELLRELTAEFREELAQWYSIQGEFEDKLSETHLLVRATDERVNRVVASQVALQEEVSNLKKDIHAEIEKYSEETLSILKEHEEKLSEHENLFDTQDQNLQNKFLQLENTLNELESQLVTQSNLLKSLENWTGEKGAVVATLSQKDQELEKSINELEELIGELENDLKIELQDELNSLEDKLSSQLEILEKNLEDLEDENEDEFIRLQNQIEELKTVLARSDGQFLQGIEENKIQIEKLLARNNELESDLRNLAVNLQRERQSSEQQASELQNLQNDIEELEQKIDILASEVGFSEEQLAELNQKISEEISAQINATLIREQRLERQLNKLRDEFDSFKKTAEEENQSAKNSATIAMVIGALGIVIGFIR